MSFAMIFSIILIGFIIATAVYAINFFLGISSCSNIGLFHSEFQRDVDKAWVSEISKDTFVGKLPRRIESVCLGSLMEPGEGVSSKEYSELRRFRNFEGNIFLYPPKKACDFGIETLEHVDLSGINGLKCFPVNKGEIRFSLDKGSFDSLVKVGG